MQAQTLLVHLALVLLAFVATPTALFAQKDPSRVFGDIKYLICSARPRDAAQWRDSMRSMGMLPLPGTRGQTPTWSMVTTNGEVRAEGLFDVNADREATFYVRFFPYAEDPAPPAVLRWLFAQQGVMLEDGDALDVPLPTVTPCQGADARDFVMVSLSTGRLVRVTFSATWPKK